MPLQPGKYEVYCTFRGLESEHKVVEIVFEWAASKERASRAVAEQQAKVSSQGVDATNSSNQEAGENEQNPAISNPRWEDAKGQAITKALVGDEVYLCADITDIADGATATIKIVEKDDDGTDDPVATLSAVVSGGKIKCQWQVQYTADDDDADGQKELKEKGYTLPEYAFVVECGGATSGESGVLEVRGGLKVQLKDKKTNTLLKNRFNFEFNKMFE